MANQYEVLKQCKKNEHRIFVKVPVKKREVDYSLAQAPPAIWAGRVMYYLTLGGIPPEDIREQEPTGGIVATCGHRIRKVMWEVETVEDGCTIFSVICPTCYSRYRDTYKKARRETFHGGSSSARMKVTHAH